MKTKWIYHTIILIGVITLISGFLIVFSAYAQGRNLEVKYPGSGAPTTTNTPLSVYLEYIFHYSMIIAGVIALGVFVVGGVRYLISAGNPAVIDDARDQIFSGFLGLVILLSSYLLLNTINPDLVNIKEPTLEVTCLSYCDKPSSKWPSNCKDFCGDLNNPFKNPGIYLLTKNYKKGDKCVNYAGRKGNCLFTNGNISDLQEFDGKINKISCVNPDFYNNWAILFEGSNYTGQCRIFPFQKTGKNKPTLVSGGDDWGKVNKPSSVIVFKHSNRPTFCTATLYTKPNYQGDSITIGKMYNNPQNLPNKFDNNVRSIKIHGHGIVILFKDKDAKGDCYVTTQSIADLSNTDMGSCLTMVDTGIGIPGFATIQYPWYKPCASSIGVYATKH